MGYRHWLVLGSFLTNYRPISLTFSFYFLIIAMLASFHSSNDFYGRLTLSRTWNHFGDIGHFPPCLWFLWNIDQFPWLSWYCYEISVLTPTWIHFNEILANLCYFLIIFMKYLETSTLAILAKFCNFLCLLWKIAIDCTWIHFGEICQFPRISYDSHKSWHWFAS